MIFACSEIIHYTKLYSFKKIQLQVLFIFYSTYRQVLNDFCPKSVLHSIHSITTETQLTLKNFSS